MTTNNKAIQLADNVKDTLEVSPEIKDALWDWLVDFCDLFLSGNKLFAERFAYSPTANSIGMIRLVSTDGALEAKAKEWTKENQNDTPIVNEWSVTVPPWRTREFDVFDVMSASDMQQLIEDFHHDAKNVNAKTLKVQTGIPSQFTEFHNVPLYYGRNGYQDTLSQRVALSYISLYWRYGDWVEMLLANPEYRSLLYTFIFHPDYKDWDKEYKNLWKNGWRVPEWVIYNVKTLSQIVDKRLFWQKYGCASQKSYKGFQRLHLRKKSNISTFKWIVNNANYSFDELVAYLTGMPLYQGLAAEDAVGYLKSYIRDCRELEIQETFMPTNLFQAYNNVVKTKYFYKYKGVFEYNIQGQRSSALSIDTFCNGLRFKVPTSEAVKVLSDDDNAVAAKLAERMWRNGSVTLAIMENNSYLALLEIDRDKDVYIYPVNAVTGKLDRGTPIPQRVQDAVDEFLYSDEYDRFQFED